MSHESNPNGNIVINMASLDKYYACRYSKPTKIKEKIMASTKDTQVYSLDLL